MVRYTLGFTVQTEDASDVTSDMLMLGVMKRVAEIIDDEHEDFIDACTEDL